MASAAQTLARAVIEGARIYSEGYDTEAAKEALEKKSPYVDFGRFHRKSLHDSCMEANKEIGYAAYLLLTGTWNDALEWAQGIHGVLQRQTA